MRTRIARSVWLLALCMLGVIAMRAVAQDASTTKGGVEGEGPISVRMFGRGVIGYLEHELGTVVRITGVTVDGDSTRRKADAGETLLLVETVNGVKLDRPIHFYFWADTEKFPEPEPGQRFDYYVHESGEFSGFVHTPEELNVEVFIPANDGFYYRPYITIHKSMPVPD